MGLLDAWGQRRLAQRREGRIEFLGEQVGSVEDTLKRELILEFVTRPYVRRAYLARVGFEPQAAPVVALCLLSDTADESLVTRIGEIVRRQLNKDQFLDVVYMTAEQDTDVARVCAPFYSRPG